MDKKKWKSKIKSLCKKADTYKPYFDPVVDALADILEQRDRAFEQYQEEGGIPVITHVNKAGAENMTKNPMLTLWMDLNTLALSYWREVGLTPSALRKITGDAPGKEEKGSPLISALNSIVKDGAG